MKRLTWSCAVILSAFCGSCKEGEVDNGAPEPPAGTDTGNPYGDDLGGVGSGEGTAGGACDETVSDVGLDEQTPLGFSADDVLAFAGGEHTVSLAWVESNVAYGPEHGRSEITLTVEPLAAHFVARSPKTSSGSGPTIDIGTPLDGCRGSVKIDVRLGLSTQGGALAETVDTVIEASAADFASGGFSADLAMLAGSFEAQLTAPRNSELTRSSLQASFGFSQYGAVGSLSLFSEFRSLDGNAAGVGGGGPVAHFPADDYCGAANAFSVTADQAVRGVSMAAALEALNSDAPVAVRYQSGASSTLELAITSDVERVCVSFDRDQQYNGEAGGAVLEFAGSASLESADGRIDGTFPVTISAEPLGGALIFEARAEQSAQDRAEAAALPASFGVQDEVGFDAYGGGSALFQSASSPSGAGGSLTLNGFIVPECISNPPVVDPAAGSAPGCRGVDLVPLWSATWGNTSN
jgi:hypothetical protein